MPGVRARTYMSATARNVIRQIRRSMGSLLSATVRQDERQPRRQHWRRCGGQSLVVRKDLSSSILHDSEHLRISTTGDRGSDQIRQHKQLVRFNGTAEGTTNQFRQACGREACPWFL